MAVNSIALLINVVVDGPEGGRKHTQLIELINGYVCENSTELRNFKGPIVRMGEGWYYAGRTLSKD